LAISGTFDVTPLSTSLGATPDEHPEDVRDSNKERVIGLARIRCRRGAWTQGDRSLMWEPPGVDGADRAGLVRYVDSRRAPRCRPSRGPELCRERWTRRGGGLFNYSAGKLLKGHKIQKDVSIDKPHLRCGLQ
jgi:hypothetical protein